MSTFSYSTGNPNNLTGGSSASMNDIQGPFTDLRTFLNGGNLDYGNLASTVDSQYETVFTVLPGAPLTALAAGNTYTVPSGGQVGVSGSYQGAMWLDPADYTKGSRSTKYRLRVAALTNATAPTSTFTAGLYQITSVGGTPGLITAATGAVIAGSTVGFAAQGASTIGQGNSGDFAAPAAGLYTVAVAVTVATMVANSAVAFAVDVQMRTV